MTSSCGDKLEGEGPFWRLKPGLLGLKRFMPDSAIKAAKANAWGWDRHYEPVCAHCPALTARTPQMGDK